MQLLRSRRVVGPHEKVQHRHQKSSSEEEDENVANVDVLMCFGLFGSNAASRALLSSGEIQLDAENPPSPGGRAG